MRKTVVSAAVVALLTIGNQLNVFAATGETVSTKNNEQIDLTLDESLVLSNGGSHATSPLDEIVTLKSLNFEKKESNNQEAEVAVEEPARELPIYHVQEGDTLDSIAASFGVSVDDLFTWNEGLAGSPYINTGDEIRIDTEIDPATVEQAIQAAAAQAKAEAESAAAAEQVATVVEEVVPVVEEPVVAAPVEEVVAAPTSGTTVTVAATAYSCAQPGLSSFTALGIDLTQNPRVIAVDPSVIPLGSRVYVEGYGEAIAGDTGGAIVGNKIDVHFSSVAECYSWGYRTSVQVTILQ